MTVDKSLKYFFHCYRRVDRIGVSDVSRLVEERNSFFSCEVQLRAREGRHLRRGEVRFVFTHFGDYKVIFWWWYLAG